jgi:hypothetical protein
MDFLIVLNDTHPAPALLSRIKELFLKKFVNQKPAVGVPVVEPAPVVETDQQRFERVLARNEFKPLKAVLDNLGIVTSLMNAAIVTTNSYQNFLSKLGYRTVLVKQIHEQDCYSRLGPAGGIRAVLPVHDTATYSTMVTLVNFDSTVSTTFNAIDYYDDQLAEFKTQLMSRTGNPR